MEFKNIAHPDHAFFDFLPQDWKDELLPQWINLKATAQVFVLEEHLQVVCMGILFYKVLPNLSPLEKIVRKQFEDYLYIGYLYTLPQYRSRGLASKWLETVKQYAPQKNFWLTVEDPNLVPFYTQNGFVPLASPNLSGIETQEIILYSNCF